MTPQPQQEAALPLFFCASAPLRLCVNLLLLHAPGDQAPSKTRPSQLCQDEAAWRLALLQNDPQILRRRQRTEQNAANAAKNQGTKPLAALAFFCSKLSIGKLCWDSSTRPHCLDGVLHVWRLWNQSFTRVSIYRSAQRRLNPDTQTHSNSAPSGSNT